MGAYIFERRFFGRMEEVLTNTVVEITGHIRSFNVKESLIGPAFNEIFGYKNTKRHYVVFIYGL